jgi:hypothetical protein
MTGFCKTQSAYASIFSVTKSDATSSLRHKSDAKTWKAVIRWISVVSDFFAVNVKEEAL